VGRHILVAGPEPGLGVRGEIFWGWRPGDPVGRSLGWRDWKYRLL